MDGIILSDYGAFDLEGNPIPLTPIKFEVTVIDKNGNLRGGVLFEDPNGLKAVKDPETGRLSLGAETTKVYEPSESPNGKPVEPISVTVTLRREGTIGNIISRILHRGKEQ